MPPIRLLAATLMLSACAAQKHSVTYSSIGDAQIAADSDVVKRYFADYERRHPTSRVEYVRERDRQAKTPSRAQDVRVLVDAFPEGVEEREGNLSIKRGSPHSLLGRVVLKAASRSVLSRQEIVDELRHLAIEAGGNVVMMSFADATQDYAYGAVGYILKSDLSLFDMQRTRIGKVPLEI